MSTIDSSSRPKPCLASPFTTSTRALKFTPLMQDRQARNKDPKTGGPISANDTDNDDAHSSKRPSRRVSASDDAYESAERRRWAATILDSPELLMMHAASRNDSVPGTMHHFTKILCGFDDELRDERLKIQYRQRKRMSKKDRDDIDGRTRKCLTEKKFVPYTGPFEM